MLMRTARPPDTNNGSAAPTSPLILEEPYAWVSDLRFFPTLLEQSVHVLPVERPFMGLLKVRFGQSWIEVDAAFRFRAPAVARRDVDRDRMTIIAPAWRARGSFGAMRVRNKR
jgi:hypothetical protein